MSDPIGALIAALKADAAVAALVADDVYGQELPQGVAGRASIAALVVTASGGPSLTGESDAALSTQRIDLVAYGPTPREADVVRAAGARCLRRIQRREIAGTLIHWVQEAGGFTAARDRDGQWPQSFQSFQLLYALGD